MNVGVSRTRHAAYLLPLALAALIGALYFRAQPHWLADPDAQDYAQLGRQLVMGRGPVTAFMPWNALQFLSERGADLSDWPNITRFPLMPALMAVAFGLFGANDEAVHLPALLGYALAACGAGLLGLRVYGAWPGLIAGLATATLPLSVNYSLTGLTEPLLGALIVLATACVVRTRPIPRPLPPSEGEGENGRLSRASVALPLDGGGWTWDRPRPTSSGGGTSLALLGGALLGLAILTRYDAAALNLPILALWLLRGEDRARRIACFVLAQAVLVLPWSAFLFAHTGSPLFSIQTASIATQASGLTDGLGWYEPVYATIGDAFARDPGQFWRHVEQEMAATPNNLRKLVGWPLALAGLASVLLDVIPSTRRRGALLGTYLLLAVALKMLTVSVVGLSLTRYFVPFVPLLLVVVAGNADVLLRSVAEWPRRGAERARPHEGSLSVSMDPSVLGSAPRAARTHLFLLFCRAALLLALVGPSARTVAPLLIPPDAPPGPPTRTGEVEARPENLARLAEVVPPGALVAANVPWSVAWLADRRSVPLPPSPRQTADLEHRFSLTISAIYVAGQVSIVDAPQSWREWEALRRQGEAPPGYVLAESFPNGGRLYLRAP